MARLLFFRLNVFPIYVPPLRERKEDIILLAQHFLNTYGRKLDKRIERLPAEETKRLLDYHWPGNVRELKNAIERVIIFSDGHGIRFADLDCTSAQNVSGIDLGRMTLADVERSHITKILNLAGWKKGGRNGAAEILGLKRETLSYRMKKLGIKRPSVAVLAGSEEKG